MRGSDGFRSGYFAHDNPTEEAYMTEHRETETTTRTETRTEQDAGKREEQHPAGGFRSDKPTTHGDNDPGGIVSEEQGGTGNPEEPAKVPDGFGGDAASSPAGKVEERAGEARQEFKS